MQGIAVAERAYQKAVAYAKDRVQSRPVDGSAKQSVAIIQHPDVRRMLATMRALTEGARALAYVAAAHSDIAHRHADAAVQAEHQAIYEFLVPIVKGWSTELSIEVASLGVQVHGGMGFIEETGAAQYYRDARILTDLRRHHGDSGERSDRAQNLARRRRGGEVDPRPDRSNAWRTAGLRAFVAATRRSGRCTSGSRRAARRWQARSNSCSTNAKSDPNAVFAGGVPYLKLAGIVLVRLAICTCPAGGG